MNTDHQMDVNLMVELLSTCAAIGRCTAKLNWIRMGDPFGTSNEFGNISFELRKLSKEKNLLITNAELIFSYSDMKLLSDECVKSEAE